MERLDHEQCLLACKLDGRGQAVMNAVRGVQSDSRMMVCVIVPSEERAAETAGVLDRTEALRKLRPVLHSAKLRFRERVVIRNIGSRMRFGDAEISQ